MNASTERAYTRTVAVKLAVRICALCALAAVLLVAPLQSARANPFVIPGEAVAACAYNDSTSTLSWSGAAAGWSRGNLQWTLYVIDPWTDTTIGALTHSGIFYNSTGGVTQDYKEEISGSAWEIQMDVTGPGGTQTGFCYTD